MKNHPDLDPDLEQPVLIQDANSHQNQSLLSNQITKLWYRLLYTDHDYQLKSPEQEGFRFQTEKKHYPLKNMEVRYLRPAEYDDLLTIRTTLKDITDKDIFFYVEIFNEKGKTINGAKVRLMFIDAATKKSVPTPEILLEKLTSQREIIKKTP